MGMIYGRDDEDDPIRVMQDPVRCGQWCYIIDRAPDYFVSEYRYKSAETARKAGERDFAETVVVGESVVR